MTSRERVCKTLNHEIPDRVPIDLGAMGATSISAMAYDKVKKALGIDTPTKVAYTMSFLAQIEPEVLERLHIDVVPLDPTYSRWAGQDASEGVRKVAFDGTEVYLAPGTRIDEQPDGSWILLSSSGQPVAKMPKDGFYFDFLRTTMSSLSIDPAKCKPQTSVPDEELASLAERAKYLDESTDKAILGWGYTISFLGMSAGLSDNITQGALDEWLCMLMAEKDTANEMMARVVDASISCLKQVHQAVGDRCFAWGIASDDAGTQRSELIAPELFQEMIIPHYKRLCDWVHANTSWKTFLHSCGSIYHYIPLWIDAGIDILNPIQTSAVNMDPARLKDEFGGKVVFWGGGCDTQSVLHKSSPEQIREHVRQRMETFKPGGGFVFNQVHNIQANVPPENVIAMFDAAHEFGGY